MPKRLNSTRVRAGGLVLVPSAGAVYLAFTAGGTGAGVAATIALGCLGILLLRATPGSADARAASAAAAGAVMALPGLLTVYFAFNAGGFFPEKPAFVAILLVLILVVRVTTADDPFAGFSWPLAIATAGLSLLCVWILLSGAWSDAPARALIEFDRAFLYLLALVLFGSMPRNSASLRWMLRGVALAIVAVALAGLLSRTLPDVFPTEPPLFADRLGFPLTYWNGVGILSAIGAILCLHFASSLREPRAVRSLGAAALPVLAATVLLTFSRGAIASGMLGLVIYVLIGRPRGLLTALLATLPAAGVAVAAAYGATALASEDPTGPAAVEQGHDLAVLVGACAVAAALLRLALAPLDARVARWTPPAALRRGGRWSHVAVAFLVTVGLVVALDVPGRVADQYESFVETPEQKRDGPTRERLRDLANSGRLDHWEIALDAYREEKLHGQGAGTYALRWTRDRPGTQVFVDDAHSLYIEALGELGLVGFVLVAIVVGLVLVGLAGIRRHRRDRTLHAALLAAGGAWAVHAGIDWDWEMPAVTIWVFCLGGACLASRTRRTAAPNGPGRGIRLVIGTILLVGAIAPSLLLVSQRQLDDAADAFERGDCAAATRHATDSIRTLEIRPEPYEVLAFCHVRRGFDRLGAVAMQEAVERDPDNWEFYYGLAVVRGSAGLDPRPAARAALHRNPKDILTRSLVRYVRTSNPHRWVTKTRPIAENERLSVVD